MIKNLFQWRAFKVIAYAVLVAFVSSIPGQSGYAQTLMPAPGQMVHGTPAFTPTLMKGVQVDVEDPFNLSFIMHNGQELVTDSARKDEYEKLIRYFMTSLVIPNRDMWVNLSPKEATRIIPDKFSMTEMGRDLLAQDYLLKQFTASLMYPEDDLGRAFWSQIYEKAYQEYGTTDIPIDTFNKVWITADKADIYQKDNTAFLVDSHLKVMLEQDLMAANSLEPRAESLELRAESGEQRAKAEAGASSSKLYALSSNLGAPSSANMASDIVRKVIIPVIEKEVNEGANFAAVRQAYHSMILATWFKKTLKDSLLGQVYADQSKVDGIALNDPQAKERIYEQYLAAYKKGVFNYIKDEFDSLSQETLPRKYFAGGMAPFLDSAMNMVPFSDAAQKMGPNMAASLVVDVSLLGSDGLDFLTGTKAQVAAAKVENAGGPEAQRAREREAQRAREREAQKAQQAQKARERENADLIAKLNAINKEVREEVERKQAAVLQAERETRRRSFLLETANEKMAQLSLESARVKAAEAARASKAAGRSVFAEFRNYFGDLVFGRSRSSAGRLSAFKQRVRQMALALMLLPQVAAAVMPVANTAPLLNSADGQVVTVEQSYELKLLAQEENNLKDLQASFVEARLAMQEAEKEMRNISEQARKQTQGDIGKFIVSSDARNFIDTNIKNGNADKVVVYIAENLSDAVLKARGQELTDAARYYRDLRYLEAALSQLFANYQKMNEIYQAILTQRGNMDPQALAGLYLAWKENYSNTLLSLKNLGGGGSVNVGLQLGGKLAPLSNSIMTVHGLMKNEIMSGLPTVLAVITLFDDITTLVQMPNYDLLKNVGGFAVPAEDSDPRTISLALLGGRLGYNLTQKKWIAGLEGTLAGVDLGNVVEVQVGGVTKVGADLEIVRLKVGTDLLKALAQWRMPTLDANLSFWGDEVYLIKTTNGSYYYFPTITEGEDGKMGLQTEGPRKFLDVKTTGEALNEVLVAMFTNAKLKDFFGDGPRFIPSMAMIEAVHRAVTGEEPWVAERRKAQGELKELEGEESKRKLSRQKRLRKAELKELIVKLAAEGEEAEYYIEANVRTGESIIYRKVVSAGGVELKDPRTTIVSRVPMYQEAAREFLMKIGLWVWTDRQDERDNSKKLMKITGARDFLIMEQMLKGMTQGVGFIADPQGRWIKVLQSADEIPVTAFGKVPLMRDGIVQYGKDGKMLMATVPMDPRTGGVFGPSIVLARMQYAMSQGMSGEQRMWLVNNGRYSYYADQKPRLRTIAKGSSYNMKYISRTSQENKEVERNDMKFTKDTDVFAVPESDFTDKDGKPFAIVTEVIYDVPFAIAWTHRGTAKMFYSASEFYRHVGSNGRIESLMKWIVTGGEDLTVKYDGYEDMVVPGIASKLYHPDFLGKDANGKPIPALVQFAKNTLMQNADLLKVGPEGQLTPIKGIPVGGTILSSATNRVETLQVTPEVVRSAMPRIVLQQSSYYSEVNALALGKSRERYLNAVYRQGDAIQKVLTTADEVVAAGESEIDLNVMARQCEEDMRSAVTYLNSQPAGVGNADARASDAEDLLRQSENLSRASGAELKAFINDWDAWSRNELTEHERDLRDGVEYYSAELRRVNPGGETPYQRETARNLELALQELAQWEQERKVAESFLKQRHELHMAVLRVAGRLQESDYKMSEAARVLANSNVELGKSALERQKSIDQIYNKYNLGDLGRYPGIPLLSKAELRAIAEAEERQGYVGTSYYDKFLGGNAKVNAMYQAFTDKYSHSVDLYSFTLSPGGKGSAQGGVIDRIQGELGNGWNGGNVLAVALNNRELTKAVFNSEKAAQGLEDPNKYETETDTSIALLINPVVTKTSGGGEVVTLQYLGYAVMSVDDKGNVFMQELNLQNEKANGLYTRLRAGGVWTGSKDTQNIMLSDSEGNQMPVLMDFFTSNRTLYTEAGIGMKDDKGNEVGVFVHPEWNTSSAGSSSHVYLGVEGSKVVFQRPDGAKVSIDGRVMSAGGDAYRGALTLRAGSGKGYAVDLSVDTNGLLEGGNWNAVVGVEMPTPFAENLTTRMEAILSPDGEIGGALKFKPGSRRRPVITLKEILINEPPAALNPKNYPRRAGAPVISGGSTNVIFKTARMHDGTPVIPGENFLKKAVELGQVFAQGIPFGGGEILTIETKHRSGIRSVADLTPEQLAAEGIEKKLDGYYATKIKIPGASAGTAVHISGLDGKTQILLHAFIDKSSEFGNVSKGPVVINPGQGYFEDANIEANAFLRIRNENPDDLPAGFMRIMDQEEMKGIMSRVNIVQVGDHDLMQIPAGKYTINGAEVELKSPAWVDLLAKGVEYELARVKAEKAVFEAKARGVMAERVMTEVSPEHFVPVVYTSKPSGFGMRSEEELVKAMAENRTQVIEITVDGKKYKELRVLQKKSENVLAGLAAPADTVDKFLDINILVDTTDADGKPLIAWVSRAAFEGLATKALPAPSQKDIPTLLSAENQPVRGVTIDPDTFNARKLGRLKQMGVTGVRTYYPPSVVMGQQIAAQGIKTITIGIPLNRFAYGANGMTSYYGGDIPAPEDRITLDDNNYVEYFRALKKALPADVTIVAELINEGNLFWLGEEATDADRKAMLKTVVEHATILQDEFGDTIRVATVLGDRGRSELVNDLNEVLTLERLERTDEQEKKVQNRDQYAYKYRDANRNRGARLNIDVGLNMYRHHDNFLEDIANARGKAGAGNGIFYISEGGESSERGETRQASVVRSDIERFERAGLGYFLMGFEANPRKPGSEAFWGMTGKQAEGVVQGSWSGVSSGSKLAPVVSTQEQQDALARAKQLLAINGRTGATSGYVLPRFGGRYQAVPVVDMPVFRAENFLVLDKNLRSFGYVSLEQLKDVQTHEAVRKIGASLEMQNINKEVVARAYLNVNSYGSTVGVKINDGHSLVFELMSFSFSNLSHPVSEVFSFKDKDGLLHVKTTDLREASKGVVVEDVFLPAEEAQTLIDQTADGQKAVIQYQVNKARHSVATDINTMAFTVTVDGKQVKKAKPVLLYSIRDLQKEEIHFKDGREQYSVSLDLDQEPGISVEIDGKRVNNVTGLYQHDESTGLGYHVNLRDFVKKGGYAGVRRTEFKGERIQDDQTGFVVLKSGMTAEQINKAARKDSVIPMQDLYSYNEKGQVETRTVNLQANNVWEFGWTIKGGGIGKIGDIIANNGMTPARAVAASLIGGSAHSGIMEAFKQYEVTSETALIEAFTETKQGVTTTVYRKSGDVQEKKFITVIEESGLITDIIVGLDFDARTGEQKLAFRLTPSLQVRAIRKTVPNTKSIRQIVTERMQAIYKDRVKAHFDISDADLFEDMKKTGVSPDLVADVVEETDLGLVGDPGTDRYKDAEKKIRSLLQSYAETKSDALRKKLLDQMDKIVRDQRSGTAYYSDVQGRTTTFFLMPNHPSGRHVLKIDPDGKVEIPMWWFEGATLTVINGVRTPGVQAPIGIVSGAITFDKESELLQTMFYKESGIMELQGSAGPQEFEINHYHVMDTPYLKNIGFSPSGRVRFETRPYQIRRVASGVLGPQTTQQVTTTYDPYNNEYQAALHSVLEDGGIAEIPLGAKHYMDGKDQVTENTSIGQRVTAPNVLDVTTSTLVNGVVVDSHVQGIWAGYGRDLVSHAGKIAGYFGLLGMGVLAGMGIGKIGFMKHKADLEKKRRLAAEGGQSANGVGASPVLPSMNTAVTEPSWNSYGFTGAKVANTTRIFNSSVIDRMKDGTSESEILEEHFKMYQRWRKTFMKDNEPFVPTIEDLWLMMLIQTGSDILDNNTPFYICYLFDKAIKARAKGESLEQFGEFVRKEYNRWHTLIEFQATAFQGQGAKDAKGVITAENYFGLDDLNDLMGMEEFVKWYDRFTFTLDGKRDLRSAVYDNLTKRVSEKVLALLTAIIGDKFSQEEFKGGFKKEVLLAKIRAQGMVSVPEGINELDALNAVLGADWMWTKEQFTTLFPNNKLSPLAEELWGKLAKDQLNADQKKKLRRHLLELAFPEDCPQALAASLDNNIFRMKRQVPALQAYQGYMWLWNQIKQGKEQLDARFSFEGVTKSEAEKLIDGKPLMMKTASDAGTRNGRAPYALRMLRSVAQVLRNNDRPLMYSTMLTTAALAGALVAGGVVGVAGAALGWLGVFAANRGTYYATSSWLDRGLNTKAFGRPLPPSAGIKQRPLTWGERLTRGSFWTLSGASKLIWDGTLFKFMLIPAMQMLGAEWEPFGLGLNLNPLLFLSALIPVGIMTYLEGFSFTNFWGAIYSWFRGKQLRLGVITSRKDIRAVQKGADAPAASVVPVVAVTASSTSVEAPVAEVLTPSADQPDKVVELVVVESAPSSQKMLYSQQGSLLNDMIDDKFLRNVKLTEAGRQSAREKIWDYIFSAARKRGDISDADWNKAKAGLFDQFERESFQKRIASFINSLQMAMPGMPHFDKIKRLTGLSPVYGETIIYTYEELDGLMNTGDTILNNLIKSDPLSWNNFIESMRADKIANEDELNRMAELGKSGQQMGNLDANETLKMQIRLWASNQGQPFGRTLDGIMNYVRWLRVYAAICHPEWDEARIRVEVSKKFQCVWAYQIWGNILSANASDPVSVQKRKDTVALLKKYHDELGFDIQIASIQKRGNKQFRVLSRYDGQDGTVDIGEPVELSSSDIRGGDEIGNTPIVVEGKGGNHTHSLSWVEGEILMGLDMNQDFSPEQIMKLSATMEEFNEKNVGIVDFPEVVPSDRITKIGAFNSLSDRTFSTSQKRLMSMLGTLFQYGHPSLWRMSAVRQIGGISSATYVNEDILAGQAMVEAGYTVKHVEYIEADKLREFYFTGSDGFTRKLGMGAFQQFMGRHMPRLLQFLGPGQALAHHFQGPGFEMGEFATVLFLASYVLNVMVLGVSLFSALPAAFVFAIAGVFVLGQASVLKAASQTMIEDGPIKGSKKFLGLWLLMVPFFMAGIFSAAAGGFMALAGLAVYIATGRPFGLSHLYLDDILKSFAKSHIVPGLAGTVGALVALGLWWNPTLALSLPFAATFFFAMLIPLVTNRGTLPGGGVSGANFLELHKVDRDKGWKLITTTATEGMRQKNYRKVLFDTPIFTLAVGVWAVVTFPVVGVVKAREFFGSFSKGKAENKKAKAQVELLPPASETVKGPSAEEMAAEDERIAQETAERIALEKEAEEVARIAAKIEEQEQEQRVAQAAADLEAARLALELARQKELESQQALREAEEARAAVEPPQEFDSVPELEVGLDDPNVLVEPAPEFDSLGQELGLEPEPEFGSATWKPGSVITAPDSVVSAAKIEVARGKDMIRVKNVLVSHRARLSNLDNYKKQLLANPSTSQEWKAAWNKVNAIMRSMIRGRVEAELERILGVGTNPEEVLEDIREKIKGLAKQKKESKKDGVVFSQQDDDKLKALRKDKSYVLRQARARTLQDLDRVVEAAVAIPIAAVSQLGQADVVAALVQENETAGESIKFFAGLTRAQKIAALKAAIAQLKIENAILRAQLSAQTQAAPSEGGVAKLAAVLAEVQNTPAKAKPVGGIDLNSDRLMINIQVDGNGMPLPLRFQDPSLMNIRGLTPVIRAIRPALSANIPALTELMQVAYLN